MRESMRVWDPCNLGDGWRRSVAAGEDGWLDGSVRFSRRTVGLIGPVIIWAGLIFWGSTRVLSANQTSQFLTPFLKWLVPGISDAAVLEAKYYIRKGGHVTEFAVLAMWIARAVRGLNEGKGWGSGHRLFLAAWLGATAYAATDEFHQSFEPTRQASVVDVMIDSGGAAAGACVVLVWVEWRARRKGFGGNGNRQ